MLKLTHFKILNQTSVLTAVSGKPNRRHRHIKQSHHAQNLMESSYSININSVNSFMCWLAMPDRLYELERCEAQRKEAKSTGRVLDQRRGQVQPSSFVRLWGLRSDTLVMAKSGVCKGVPGFLTKTFEIFSSPELSDCCGWGATGATIVISKVRRFCWYIIYMYIYVYIYNIYIYHISQTHN